MLLAGHRCTKSVDSIGSFGLFVLALRDGVIRFVHCFYLLLRVSYLKVAPSKEILLFRNPVGPALLFGILLDAKTVLIIFIDHCADRLCIIRQ